MVTINGHIMLYYHLLEKFLHLGRFALEKTRFAGIKVQLAIGSKCSAKSRIWLQSGRNKKERKIQKTHSNRKLLLWIRLVEHLQFCDKHLQGVQVVRVHAVRNNERKRVSNGSVTCRTAT
jgi:hypothetical protein